MAEEQLSEGTVRRIKDVRNALLRSHKILLDHERLAYERVNGKISNSYEYLNLVMQNSWFAWLRLLSELIVQIDELLDAKEGSRESTAAALVEQARLLLTPNEAGTEFQKRYFAALQESPEVVLAHGEFSRILGPGRLSKEVH